jgi:N-acyl-D-aspartate/D-glutamate deacylase
MDAGAIGFSVQRFGESTNHPDFDGTPFPTDLMHDETMLFLSDALRKRNEGYIQYSYMAAAEQHGGGEGCAEQVRARQHVEQVAQRCGRNILVYPCRQIDAGLDWIKSCHERGLPIYAQRPTVLRKLPAALLNAFESPNVLDSSLTWRDTMVGTVEEITAKLNSPHVRERLRKELVVEDDVGAWILVRAKTQGVRKYQGMTVSEMARARNMASHVDVFLDIAIEDGLKSDWSLPVFTNPDLAAFRKLPAYDYWMPGLSDGGAHTKNLNTAFCTTLFLMSFARDDGWLSLEEAHYRLSALPARVAGLQSNMGTLSVGAPADIVIYDLDKLSITEPQILRDYPANEWRLADHGVGYRWILVNGAVILEDDKETAVHAGRLVHTAESSRKLSGGFGRA